jgi:anthranilate phosphoribosyltransferase
MAAFSRRCAIKGETVERNTGCAQAMRQRHRRSPTRTDLVDTAERRRCAGIQHLDDGGVCHRGRWAGCWARQSGRVGPERQRRRLSAREPRPRPAHAQCIDEVHRVLFAQKLHPAMKNVAPVRKELGVRTIFNILGPLTNPAQASAQIVGVYDERLACTLARVLHALGVRAAFVFHSDDGLDELTTTDVNCVAYFNNGVIYQDGIDAAQFGLPRASRAELRGGTPAENAQTTRLILAGQERGAKRDVVALNAAAALVAGGKARDLRQGLEHAGDAMDSGRALAALNGLETSNSFKTVAA